MENNLIDHLDAITVSIDNLFLNPNNPRLMDKNRKTELNDSRITEEKIQTSVIRDIRFEGINDLYEKIKKLGFLTIDRIVVRKIDNTENYLVLEGNRRITTAKVLLKEHEEGIVTLDSKIVESLSNIEVLLYTGDSKNIIWLLQGMRHINGIKEWGALQQSRFLFEMQKDNSLNATELDKMTGFGRNTISNKIRAYKAFSFAKEIYHGDIEENNFSLFQEAIFSRPLIKEWLQWDDTEEKFLNIENLENLLNWYIGDEEGKIRINRVLDIRDGFNQILQNENKSILTKFVENPDYTLNDAIQDIKNRDAEKSAQKNQLDLNERYENLEQLYVNLTTLPLIHILKDPNLKTKFVQVLSKIQESSNFQLSHLAKTDEV